MAPEPSPDDDDRSSTPTRRRLLRWGGLGGLVFLSGCTEDIGEELPPNRKWPTSELLPDLPIDERIDILEARIEDRANAAITDENEFAATFDDDTLDVDTVEYEQAVLTIEYTNTDRYAEGTLHDIGSIAGAFAALLDSGFEADALGITVLDGSPDSFGSARIEAPWAHRYNEGYLSAKAYGELVTGTIESTRHPPTVDVSPDE